LYTLSLVFLQTAALGSDMGLSQAITSIGARIRDDHRLLGSLYSCARHYGYRFFAVWAMIVVALSSITLVGHGWSWLTASLSLFLSLSTAATQLTVTLRRSVLNLNHDATGLFQVGMTEAGARLLFVPFCLAWPYAPVALLGTFAGAFAGKLVIARRCRSRIDDSHPPFPAHNLELRHFVVPLIPVTIYQSLQGQLSVFLLGLYGCPSSLAAVGALGRLGQLVAILIPLNGFLIHPVFSRIAHKSDFARKAALTISSIAALSLLCMASVIIAPGWWLYILGGKYHDLAREVPIAVIIPLCNLLGATLYTMVISRGHTQGQICYVAIGLAGQLLFLSQHGVHSTYDALLLNLVPVAGFAALQAALLVATLSRWQGD
jgi:hypothetical protein